MTDLKPEDQLDYEALKARLSVRWERIDGAAARKINTILAERRDALTAIDSLLADRARMEKALRNLTRAFDSLQVERWDDETKVEIHLPRTKRVRPVSWVYVSDVKEARQALGASQ